jgi:NAD(P)-dependent dehydrogenase (short-subunit alcohol dehydrogenase family)
MAAAGILAGRTAFVTGASTGLGRHFALTLAGAGADVAVTARERGRVAGLAEEIEAIGCRAVPLALDVRDAEAIPGAVAAAEAALGPIDVLVNNAGVTVQKPAHETTPEDYAFVIDTNLKGSWLCAQAVGRRMIARGKGGKIVNLGSLLTFKVINQLSLYAISKAAVAQMTRALALEWARYDIQVNALCPGYIETEMNRDHWQTEAGQAFMRRFPRRRVGRPEALDDMLLLLCGPGSDFMTGSVLPVDDGQGLM